MYETRRQLTLFISDQNEIIEKIRAEFNPIQYQLIAAHITLCREDEIASIETVIANIKSIAGNKPLEIEFNPPLRFENGKGVLIPAKEQNSAFDELRTMVLKGINASPRKQEAHITLMHPRNSTCTDLIFEQIQAYKLPAQLSFNKISLIEQKDGGQWFTIEEFQI
ncbi:2'-5' RNA ligase superfamily protein [Pedobacter steynii]|uniref:2'-5' RNA ligase superfamily protein n=1 Tax=Pedobacter steynii TaxID=430522 RepID=A0A1G9YXG1_9SPHI|nr:2'-5' RNA ligase family protein [Pedobacter steynii]NQX39873.1 2'-5' RNA ligase family protein [Pedobacter steynii]SDN13869.1 2'-5' RNA ligase superfamily protein [Pedobacter steynii]